MEVLALIHEWVPKGGDVVPGLALWRCVGMMRRLGGGGGGGVCRPFFSPTDPFMEV